MRRVLLALTLLSVVATACGGDDHSLTVYSGRNEELISPLIAQFEAASGIDVEVRYGGSPELAATLREEGSNSPADVFLAQDPASLGAVAEAGLFDALPADVLAAVPARFSDTDGRWIGVSGRARVVIYDPANVGADELPQSVNDLTGPSWSGRVGIAPSNGSFLSFVAAMILTDGEEATRDWLEAMKDNDAETFSGNSVIVAAVDDGTVDSGLVNHYYLFRRIGELGDEVTAQNHFVAGGPGALVMPSGAGILASSDAADAARQFVEFLVSAEAQAYFVEETFEYPLVPGIAAAAQLPPIESINQPDIDLSDLASVLDLATDLVNAAGLL